MWLSVSCTKSRLLVGTAYRPPWLDVDDFFSALIDSVASFHGFDYTILIGDFNINTLTPNNSGVVKLGHFLHHVGLMNHVVQPTHITSHSQTAIDLVCTDAPVISLSVDHIADLGAHALITTQLNK